MSSYAERMSIAVGSPIRALAKYMSDPELISFGGGNPAPEAFPIQDISRIAQKVLAEKGPRILTYGPTNGLPELKESALEYLIRPRGVQAEIENILTLTGSQQGFDLISKVFLNKDDVVLCESASYVSSVQAFRMMQAKIVGVEMDDDGVILEDLEQKIQQYHPKLFYCIPTFQNPTGKTLPNDRRESIAKLAIKYDLIVIEDDPYCDLRYEGASHPTIKSFDETGEHVVLFNSFSKILAPGLRVGICVASEEIVNRMGLCKQSAVGFPNGLAEAIADGYLREQLVAAQVERLRALYKSRRDCMAEGIQKYFPEGTKCVVPHGGMFMWVELPGDTSRYSMEDIKWTALTEQKVAINNGADFSTIPGRYENCMRLVFSTEGAEKMTQGLQRLGMVCKQYLSL